MKYPEDFVNKIICGDCIEVMKEMKPNSVDAIVCDPPYGLEFMGKEWDKLDIKKAKARYQKGGVWQDVPGGHAMPQYQAGKEMQRWHTQWLTEAYRVLKPGGSMLVMGGTRTSHRLACAIEDTGFIIKDTLMWLYGSGFPKAQDLGKMIDKRARRQYVSVAIELGLYIPGNSKWDWTRGEHGISDKWWEKFKSFLSSGDWQKIERHLIGKQNKARAEGQKSALPTMGAKTEYIDIGITAPATDLAKHWDGFKVGGIKPAYEPIIWAVKPPEGSYVDNVLKWGVGAVNVDECRIGIENDEQEMIDNRSGGQIADNTGKWQGPGIARQIGELYKSNPKGRFPANVILSHHPECVQVGMKRVKGSHLDHFCTGGNILNRGAMHKKGQTDPNGYEQVESWDCHPDCAVRLLDEQSGVLKSGGGVKVGKRIIRNTPFTASRNYDGVKFDPDSGGASRFFYCAKASRGERGKNNKHPTVKPIKLFEYLIQLVTREEQIILDPFIGSGTTMLASQGCNRKCVGIEKDKDYCKIAEERLSQGVL